MTRAESMPHARTAPIRIASAARRTRWMKVMILRPPTCPAARPISAAREVGSESMLYTLVPLPECAQCVTVGRNAQSEGEHPPAARFGAKGKHLTGGVPAKRAHRASIAFPYENQRIVVDAHKFHRAIGVADRHDRVARMTVDDGHAGFGAREDLRLASHRAILAVERPQDELLGA